MSDEKKPSADDALKAIDALIADELASSKPGKYDRVQQLSQQASQLRRMYVTRVKDGTYNPVMGGVHIVNPLPIGDVFGGIGRQAIDPDDEEAVGQQEVARNVGTDFADLVREQIMIARADHERKSAPPKALDELLDYLLLHQRLDEYRASDRMALLSVVETKIDKLVRRLMGELDKDELDKEEDTHGDPAVVHPVVLR